MKAEDPPIADELVASRGAGIKIGIGVASGEYLSLIASWSGRYLGRS